MPKNEVFRIFADALGSGGTITEVWIDNRIDPKEITIVFADGTDVSHEIPAEHRAEFVLWWKQATPYLRENLLREGKPS